MKKSKKKATPLVLVTIMALMFSILTPVNAVAAPKNEVVIQNEEIKNAVIKIENENLITLTTTTITDGMDAKRSMVNAINEEDQIQSANVHTVALFISTPEKTEEVYDELMLLSNENSSYKTTSDYIAGLRINTTVYYTIKSADGYNWYRLISVKGGNDKTNASHIIGSGFMISKQTVTYGVAGLNLEGLSPIGHTWSAEEKLQNSANEFNISVNTSHPDWPTVLEAQGLIGATYTVSIYSTRDGKTTILELVNNPLDSLTFPTA